MPGTPQIITDVRELKNRVDVIDNHLTELTATVERIAAQVETISEWTETLSRKQGKAS